MANKKFLQKFKSPIRLLYEKKYGTTIGPWDEIYYISICARETIRIIRSHWSKKFLGKFAPTRPFKINE